MLQWKGQIHELDPDTMLYDLYRMRPAKCSNIQSAQLLQRSMTPNHSFGGDKAAYEQWLASQQTMAEV